MSRKPAIHSTAVVEGPVELGDDVEIGAFAYIRGPVSIGAGTRVYPHAVIGCDAEHKRKRSTGWIRIGAGCVIREHVAIQRGTESDTVVGDRAWLLHGAHVAHDCVLGDDVTLSPNVVLGGETRVHVGANLGIGVVCHQGSTIGAGAMVGMGAVVTRDVPPFALVVGNPARLVRVNAHALAAFGLAEGMAFRHGGGIGLHPGLGHFAERFFTDSRRERLCPCGVP